MVTTGRMRLVVVIALVVLGLGLYLASGDSTEMNSIDEGVLARTDVEGSSTEAESRALPADTSNREALSDGSTSSGEVDSEEEVVERDTVIGIGAMSKEEAERQLGALVHYHGRFTEAMLPESKLPLSVKVRTEFDLATRCVEIILRSHGRAQFESDTADGKFRFKADPNRWAFASGGAKFSFLPGEFPAYDTARKRYEKSIGGGEGELSLPVAEQISEYELLFEEALAFTGVESSDG